MTRRYTRFMLVAAVLACGSGCAKPDWIQQTLVTVDVTGLWVGSYNRPGGSVGFESRLELEQNGSKVSGTFRVVGAAVPAQMGATRSGPIDGTVAGDVFTFTQSNGPVVGEMTVSGDDMTGYMAVGYRIPISFRRVSSSPRPASQP